MRQASAGKIGSLITFQFVQSMIELKTSVAILDLTCQPDLGAKKRGVLQWHMLWAKRDKFMALHAITSLS